MHACSYYNYYIYNMYHPKKYGVPQVDLSTDEAVTNKVLDSTLMHHQLLI